MGQVDAGDPLPVSIQIAQIPDEQSVDWPAMLDVLDGR